MEHTLGPLTVVPKTGTEPIHLGGHPASYQSAIAASLVTRLIEQMRANDAPPEQYERLGVPACGDVGDEHLLLVA